MKNKDVSKTMLVFAILALHVTLYTLHGYAGGPGTTGATFLKLGVGARPAAMGEAFSAAADDVNAIYWNPAGLSKAAEKQVSFVHTEWVQAIRYEYLAYSMPALKGTIGFGATYLYIDGIERRNNNGDLIPGYIPACDIAVSASYAKAVSEKVSLGVTVKIISQQLDSESAFGAAFDAGLLFKPEKEKGVTYGFALQNIGYEAPFISVANPLPLNIKAGLASISDDANFTFSADFNYGVMDTIWAAGAGIEYWLVPAFSIRAGYKYNSAMNLTLGALSGLTCGAGFKFGITGIDYAFVPYGDLGYTHRISLLVKF